MANAATMPDISVDVRALIAPFERSLAKARAAAQKFESQAMRSMAGAAAATDKATLAATRTALGMNGAAASAGRMATSFKGATVAAGGLAGALGTVRSLLGPISLGFAGAFGVRTIADFQQAMSGVQAVTRATGEEMARMTDLARQLGATTEFTGAQAAEGMRFLGMAGFETNSILETMPAMLDLATAATLDLGRAADITSNIMTGFGLAASQSGEVADIMAATASRANTNIEQMGFAMKFVGPVASALGKDIGATSAAIGALSDAGLQGTMAGTGLRRVLSSLANPTKEAQKALSAMGITIEEVNPATHEITEIVRSLAAAGLTAADALTIFGDRGGPAILALIANEPKLRSLTETLKNAGGEADRMARTMRDNLTGDFKTAQSAVEDFFLTIGNSGGTNVLRTSVQGLTGAVRGLSENVQQLSGAMRVLSPVSSEIANDISRAASALSALSDAGMQAAGTTRAMMSGLAALPLGGVYLLIGDVSRALKLLSSGMVDVHGTTVRLGGVFEATWITAREVISGAITAVSGLASVMAEVVTLDFQGAVEAARVASSGLADHSERVRAAWAGIVAMPIPEFAAGMQAAADAANRMSFGANLPAPNNLPTGDLDGAMGTSTDTLGTGAQKALEQFRESLMSTIEAENASYASRLEALAGFRAAQQISAQEAASAMERIEAVHSANLLGIQRAGQAQEIQQRQQTVALAVGLLNQFAGKSRTAAIAAIALNKGVAIANVAINTAQAAAAALAPPPLGLGPIAGAPVAASTQLFGAAQIALIAGTGIAEAASAGKRSVPSAPSIPSSGGSSGSSAGDTYSAPSRPGHAFNITLVGESYSREQVRKLIESMNDAIADGARLVVSPN